MSLSFEIERGLFQLDFTDYHAILGISLEADTSAIRKRYIKIARRLHPDVCRLDNRDLAQAVLSKLVNPAYAKLSSEREYADYEVLLRMMGNRLMQEHPEVQLQSDRAKTLLQAERFEPEYRAAVEEFAVHQYDDLQRTLDAIGDLSELNYVYLFRREQKNKGWPQTSKDRRPTVPAPPRPSTDSFVEQYFQRAQSLLEQNSFAQARKELQDALKLDPNNSRCHGLMALVYIKQNEVKPASINLTLANSHATKALKLDPKEPIALDARKTLNRLAARAGGTAAKPKTKPPKKTDKGGGGLFGGLFGGKKK
ncbi:MAG: DnaJ domain-containing protein [Cyanobacteria bacterium SBC]|nr:DnaJ domain-containing protein [Cyanobacteria bacterium SBC]